jgi:ribosome-binding protein aMBF1 (putative translation factor)
VLGIAQRTIRVSRSYISTNRKPRKSLPKSVQTLGDLIQIKRYEKRFTLWRLAQKMGIATATVRAWENGNIELDFQEIRLLMKYLDFGVEDYKRIIGFDLCSTIRI